MWRYIALGCEGILLVVTTLFFLHRTWSGTDKSKTTPQTSDIRTRERETLYRDAIAKFTAGDNISGGALCSELQKRFPNSVEARACHAGPEVQPH
jgi:hypothetical protein